MQWTEALWLSGLPGAMNLRVRGKKMPKERHPSQAQTINKLELVTCASEG